MSDDNKILKVNNYISCGNFQSALETIKLIEEERKLTDDESLLKKYAQIFVYLDKGEFQQGRNLADKMIKESRKKVNPDS